MKKMVSFISALAMCAVMTAPMFSSAAGDDSETPNTDGSTSSGTTPETDAPSENTPSDTLREKTITIGSSDKASTVYLTSEIASTYTVIIPDGSIDLKESKDISVSAQDVVIDNGQVLTVSVKSANEWKLMDEKVGSNASLTYTLTPEGTEEALTGSGAVEILSVAAGEAWNSSVAKNMKVATSGDATMSGTYKDTLTFTVAVKDVPQQTEPTSQGDQSET